VAALNFKSQRDDNDEQLLSRLLKDEQLLVGLLDDEQLPDRLFNDEQLLSGLLYDKQFPGRLLVDSWLQNLHFCMRFCRKN
jgi:hypothetical protein